MSVTQHTPGPWVCKSAVLDFEGARFGQVAYILEKEGEQFYASAANARLIAAAPNLLAALNEAIAWDSHDTEDVEAVWLKQARAAIAKATGK